MPFLFKRIRENLFIFFVMGILYFSAYHFIAKMPETGDALFVSCAGFLAVAAIVYAWFLRTYLINLDNIEFYIKTNMSAYLAYMAVFYLLFLANYLAPGDMIYSFLFAPYDALAALGMNRFLSTAAVHAAFIFITFITPYFVRKQEM